MPPLALLGSALTVVFLAVLLLAEWRGLSWLAALAKPLASTGFLLFAVAQGALDTEYGRWILVALALSFVGDVFLLGRARGLFLGGLVSFLLAHVGYGIAFAVRGLEPWWLLGTFALLTVPRWYVLRWLAPHLDERMRIPVQLYVSVITIMVAFAAGSVALRFSLPLIAGAVAFYLSDLAVAQRRFLGGGLKSRLWGLPLYYGAQLLLASTV